MNANIWRSLFALIFLCSQALAQGFAGLGTTADGFLSPDSQRSLVFPDDHAAHPGYRIEWWYLTANLLGDDGRSYGVQWTLFRSALAPGEATGWQSPQIWMGHAALTSSAEHHFAERLARGGIGQAGVVQTFAQTENNDRQFEAWIDDWSLTGDQDLTALRVVANGDGFSYDLEAQTERELVLHGAQGYSVKSPEGQASYYYSQPDYDVSGTINLPSGPVKVTGKAWLDREWSSQPLSEEQSGWDWFSLRFDSGDKLMGFVLRNRDGRDNFRSGTWMSASGEVIALKPGEFQAIPLERAKVAGKVTPVRWEVRLPRMNVQVVVEPLNPDSWMDVSFAYWEGPVTISGSHSGQGYLEMTGYE